MATQEKLLKSLEALKTLINSNQNSDGASRKKDKIQHCNFITEAMSNPTIKIASNFINLLSFSIEVFLQLCDDPESDIRMISDECLNRIIKAMNNGNVGKVQIELHKEIKKNGAARSLRAALTRFAQLAHLIRPHKGKPYIVNLVPCIVKISERDEDMVHETLASTLPKILACLGCFTTDNDIKALLKAFLANVHSTSAVIRRTTASCILTTCLNCRKPYVFITYVLNSLIEFLVPVQEHHSTALILCVLGCLKNIFPHIKSSESEQEIKGSFGMRKEINEFPVAVDRLLQAYELCLHYTNHTDHNIINASLETLNILLQNCPPELKTVLLSPNGLVKSRIQLFDGPSKLRQRSPSQISVATTLLSGDETFKTLESELTDTIKSDIERWIDESKLSVMNVTFAKTTEIIEKQHTISVSDTNTTGSSFDHIDASEYSNITIGTISDHCADSVRSESFMDNLDKLILSENSSEKSYSQCAEEKGYSIISENVIFQEIDVGEFCDKNVPLNYCTRHITKSFLLTGCPSMTVPDKVTRVSVKSLALGCLSTIFQIYPRGLLLYLDKNCAKTTSSAKNGLKQQVSDVLLFANHPDPQLRGVVRILIGSFLKAVLLENEGEYSVWVENNSLVNSLEGLELRKLLEIIIKGLEDESSTCSRQSLTGLQIAFKYIIESLDSIYTIPVLNVLPLLAKNPYWLVKVKLLELLSDIQYVTVQHIFESREFQNKVLYNVLYDFLKDEDQRVRNACSNTLVKIIPYLYFEQDHPKETAITMKAIELRKQFLSNLCNVEYDASVNKKNYVANMPFPFYVIGDEKCMDIENSLSRIISMLHQYLLTSTSKHFIFGCTETLCLLSNKYPPTLYKNAWSCFKSFNVLQEKNILQRSLSSGGNSIPVDNCHISNSTDLLAVCVNLLTHSTFGYDFSFHLNLLKLTGNLYSGKCIENLKSTSDINPEETKHLWDIFSDKTLVDLSEQFLNHIVKLLNIFAHVLDEVVPHLPQSKTVLPNLPAPSSLSPIKRRKSDLSEKSRILSQTKGTDKDDKSDRKSDSVKVNSMGYFVSIPHYMKIYEQLRTAYNNYKITLDTEASENFICLLNTTLSTLSQILEVGTLVESGRIAEEILSYLRATFNLEAASTVECVQQLLKSLFGSNLASNISEMSSILNKYNIENESEDLHGFYFNICQKPYNEISSCIKGLHSINKLDCNGDNTVMGYLHRRESKKIILAKGSDKILASYIRIFEPMVIKSLKQYTVTSDVKLQCRVLQLLSQLVQLRVNYCLLDSEQIFIGFVLKQFEFIEEGQILYSNELIPKIFRFLVHLSYGKQHSKSIIGVPKILQLCDGLMASGQSPITHCIPALRPIVEDIFLLRNKSNTPDFKELETTREVLLSMLLRLLEYHEVIDLLVLILNESKYCDNGDKWLRWSKQIVDVLVPMLKQNKVQLDNAKAYVSIRKLIFMLNPNVLKPVNEFLVMLFQEPCSLDDSLGIHNRWISKVLSLLLILLQTKEDVLLIKVLELQVDFHPSSIFYVINFTPDPLNVTATSNLFERLSPELIFVRFIFRVIDITTEKCLQIAKNEENSFIVEQLSILLMFCSYIFQSGSHCKTTNVAIDLVNNTAKLKSNDIRIEKINSSFVKLGIFFPTVTIQWCYLLFLLNYNNKEFWKSVLTMKRKNTDEDNKCRLQAKCMNLEIVQIGGCIVFCDYLSDNVANKEQLSWMLTNYVDVILHLSEEAPILEFLASLHRDKDCCAMFLQVISNKCYKSLDPLYKTKILNSIENVHTSQAGTLLYLLVLNLLDSRQLALSRLVANLASRKIEFLLTLNMEEVHTQLPKEKLMEIMEFLVTSRLAKKHETLVSLLNKLSSQFYDLSPIEFDQRRAINPGYIKKLNINKSWYLSQVKARCSTTFHVGPETAELLSNINYSDLLEIMNTKDFNKCILKDSIAWCTNKMKTMNIFEPPNLLKASVEVLLKDVRNVVSLLPKSHEVFRVYGREPTLAEEVYSSNLSKLLEEEDNRLLFHNIIPSISHFIDSLFLPGSVKIPDSNVEDLVKFAVACLESISYLIDVHKKNININYFDVSLNCADIIFKQSNLCNILALDSHITWLCSSVNSIYKIVSYLLLDEEPLPSVHKDGLKTTLDNVETVSAGFCCYQLSVLVTWIENTQNSKVNVPEFLLNYVRSIVISLARLPLTNSYILTPPTAWRSGWEPVLSGSFKTQVPPLPIRLLQEIEILEEFIFRITLLGWTSRQQFEETWMCLLSVLSPSPSESSVPEEVNAITHASSVAVQAITSLLMESLYVPVPGNRNISKLVHVPRDLHVESKSASIKKLKSIHNKFENMFTQFSKSFSNDSLVNVFKKPNLEKRSEAYSYSQVSVEYLTISARIADTSDEKGIAARVYVKRQQILEESGLDLNSCLQFLLELYSQWIKCQGTTPLRILHEVVKSMLLISDLFTEKSQFSWMLESCLELSKTHIAEDEILHQYLVIGICKASAVLLPDLETLDTIKKLLTQSLKSAFLPARIASLHGILYILQGCILANTIIGGVSEEMQLFLPVAVEYVQCNINVTSGVLYHSQEHTLLLWALSFYLIENVDELHLDSEFISVVTQTSLANLTAMKFNIDVHNSIMKGLERLVIKKSLPEKINSQIMKFALGKIKHANHVIALPAVQLLLSCMYTECAGQLENTEESNGIVQSNPDNLVQTIEKVSAIFDKIKRGYPAEVELLCAVLPTILNDFFPPSDILTKVIGEFLSPQQRHPKLLSRVVFQVFECAINQSQLLLLQDWVVFSLSNFTQLFPIGMATWCLTCFFISATTNEWLRALFPYVQSRIGRYEYEDKKILCIAGADFYSNLTNEKQKLTFVETFEKVKDQVDTPFNDLLASL